MSATPPQGFFSHSPDSESGSMLEFSLINQDYF